MMHSIRLYLAVLLVFAHIALALPRRREDEQLERRNNTVKKRWADVPLLRRRKAKRSMHKRDGKSGSIGLGDSDDLFYSVALQLGNTTTSFNLDTGSSDLWVISEDCQTQQCKNSTVTRYPLGTFTSSDASVVMQYGDSTTGTSASGPVGHDTATLAGIAISQQQFAAVNKTDSTIVVDDDAAGIFGLGFPSESQVQAAVVNQQFNTPLTTDEFVSTTSANGPLLSRLVMSGELEQPMFTITLQRDTIDVSGKGGNPGVLTVGSLPDGVDNSSLTWVPVRLYSLADGGLQPPTFAPNEIYPLRWEVELDAVYLDGQKLASSTIKSGVKSKTVSALIDTGNSLLRGPADVVQTIMSTVSSSFASQISSNANAVATYPCATPHTLAYQIGGQMFPVDPRDFAVQDQNNDANTCYVGNLVSTDPPSVGGLFSWSLGDPFFKSNLIAFYYGNLTHPSADPPRIGFMSTVPSNSNNLLEQAVSSAVANGGNFASTSDNPLAATATQASTTFLVSGAPTMSLTKPSAKSQSTQSSAKHSGAFSSRACRVDGVWITLFASLALLFHLA